MARAFAENQSVEITLDGMIHLTLKITFVDVSSARIATANITATFDSLANTIAVDNAILTAVQGKANELGFNLTAGRLLYPGFNRV